MSMGLFRPNIEKLKAKKKVGKLIKAGKHRDPDVRRKSISALGEIGDPRAVEPLIEGLEEHDFDIVDRAVEALAKLGDPRAVEPLLRILNPDESHYWLYRSRISSRKHVALALSAFSQKGDERAVEFFIQALKDRKHADIRQTARDALGRIEDKRAIKLLVRALTDENAEVRRAAAEALDRLAWKPEDVLESAYYLLARDDSRLLRERGETVLPGFLHIVASDSRQDIRNSAARALGTVGDKRAVGPLIQALTDENITVGRAAAEALGEIGDEPAVEALIQVLGDKDVKIRPEAARALGRIGDKRAVGPLMQALTDESITVGEAAAEALGEIGDEPAVEALIQVLGDKGRFLIRPAAAAALSKIGDKRYANELMDYLFSNPSDAESKDPNFQRTAIPYKNMFHDYADLIIRITSYESLYARSSGIGSYRTEIDYSIKGAESAVTELSKIPSPICNNILHKIAEMNDIEVLIYEGEREDCSYYSKYGKLSFEVLREKAREELKKRGNVPFEPSAFLVEDGWKI